MTLFKNKYRIETTRLRGWDYASAGWYFVTICTRNRLPFFGAMERGDMRLSPIGEIAADFWAQIPRHTAGNVDVDAFIVMPNHVHGIVVTTSVETLHCNVSRMSRISPALVRWGRLSVHTNRRYRAGVHKMDIPNLAGNRVSTTISSATNGN